MTGARPIGLGIDAGGTNTKILLVSASGKILRTAQVPTKPEKSPRAFITRVASAVRKAETSLGHRAESACLAVAGDVDPEKGLLRRSPNLPAFEKFLLREHLGRALKRSVAVHNDANMAAWACYSLELKRRYPNVVALAMGTGIGGGVVMDGRLHTGATGSAGELGHMRVSPGGASCRCGADGCLEAYAGKYGIVRTARDLAEASAQATRLGRRKNLEPEHVARAAEQGDSVAKETWDSVGRALGVGIINMIYLLNPDVVMLVGGVAKAERHFMPSVRRALKAESFRAPFGTVRLKVAKRADLGAIGAALYSLETGQ
jgi:glucokinase